MLQNLSFGAACPSGLAAAFEQDVRSIHDALQIVKVLLCSGSCFVSTARSTGSSGPNGTEERLAVVKSYTKARMDAMALRQAELEVTMLQQLQHNEHVVPFWLAAEDASQLHIVTQHCSEGDLREVLRRCGGRPLAEAAVRDQVARPLLAALSDMHALGFVHRDVKPENVFLLDNQLLLGDFGLAVQLTPAATAGPDMQQQDSMQVDSSGGSARASSPSPAAAAAAAPRRSNDSSSSSAGSDATCELSGGSNDGGGGRRAARGKLQQWHSMSSMATSPSSTPRQQAGGTPAYTAPEVVASAFNNTSPAAALSPQNDVWSLGVLVLECLCGRHPFVDDASAHPGAILSCLELGNSKQQLLLRQLPVSQACRDWLVAALAPDPLRRATSAQLLQHEWMAAELPAVGPWQAAAAPQPLASAAGAALRGAGGLACYSQQQLQAMMLSQRSCPDELMLGWGCTSGDEGWGISLQQPSLSCSEGVEAARLWDAGCLPQLPGIRGRRSSLPRPPIGSPALSSGGHDAAPAAAGAGAGCSTQQAVAQQRQPGAAQSSSACGGCGGGGDKGDGAAAAGLQRNALSCTGQAAGGSRAAARADRLQQQDREQQREQQREQRQWPAVLGAIASWED